MRSNKFTFFMFTVPHELFVFFPIYPDEINRRFYNFYVCQLFYTGVCNHHKYRIFNNSILRSTLLPFQMAKNEKEIVNEHPGGLSTEMKVYLGDRSIVS